MKTTTNKKYAVMVNGHTITTSKTLKNAISALKKYCQLDNATYEQIGDTNTIKTYLLTYPDKVADFALIREIREV